MPNIKIREQEALKPLAFDITENTVLIPMLYARGVDAGTGEYRELKVDSKLFTGVSSFEAWMSADHRVNVDNALDRSYAMAYELLLQGMNVVVKPILYDNINLGQSISEDDAYAAIEDAINGGALDEFRDRNIYNIKFITTGGYANCGKSYSVTVQEEGQEEEEVETRVTSSYTKIRDLAEYRGDSIALVEFRDYFDDEQELFTSIREDFSPAGSDLYAAAFFPWFKYTTSAGGSQRTANFPACFGYLLAYAYSVKSNANWFAAAGVARGFIPGLVKPSFDVGEALMHILQGDDIDDEAERLDIVVNPIFNAGTYGYRIWGNRVINKAFVNVDNRFMNFLNVRMLLCDIKKQIYHAAMRCTFEPNDDIVWINFKTLANSLLDQMKSGRGISWYKWTKEVAETKATIKATLTIRPIEAVESFDINIVLTDEEVEIVEEA